MHTKATTKICLADIENELSVDKEYSLTESMKLLKRIHHYDNTITQLEKEFKVIDEFDRSCGHLWAASGERLNHNGHLLDWALIDLPAHRSLYNTLPSNDELRSISLPAKIEEMSALVSDSRVFKRGRSTGLTIGKASDRSSTTEDGYRCGIHTRKV
ncbi:hypothetical protein V8E54_011329 [Elaphomyces granulatus]